MRRLDRQVLGFIYVVQVFEAGKRRFPEVRRAGGGFAIQVGEKICRLG